MEKENNIDVVSYIVTLILFTSIIIGNIYIFNKNIELKNQIDRYINGFPEIISPK